jgi:hypothetical protein
MPYSIAKAILERKDETTIASYVTDSPVAPAAGDVMIYIDLVAGQLYRKVEIFSRVKELASRMRDTNYARPTASDEFWSMPIGGGVGNLVAPVTAVAEVQAMDLTGIAGGIDDVITFTLGDTETMPFILTAAITDDSDMDAALNGKTLTDTGGRDWTTVAVGDDGSITFTQVGGDEESVGAITGTVVGNESAGGTNTDPTIDTSIVTTHGAAGVQGIGSVVDGTISIGMDAAIGSGADASVVIDSCIEQMMQFLKENGFS